MLRSAALLQLFLSGPVGIIEGQMATGICNHGLQEYILVLLINCSYSNRN